MELPASKTLQLNVLNIN